MKKIEHILLIIIVATGMISFIGCSDEDDIFHPWVPTEVVGIDVEGVDQGVLTLYTGGVHKLVIKYAPDDAANIKDLKLKYESSDEKLFTVSEKGEIVVGEAEGEGLLHITDVDNPKLQFACAIVIVDEFFPITEIIVNDQLQDYVAFVGQKIRLEDFMTVAPTNASIPKVSFKVVEGSEVANFLDEEDVTLLSMLAVGSVTIRVSAEDGVSDVIKDFVITIKEGGNDTFLERSGWTVKSSHKAPKDTQTVGPHEFMLDGNTATIASYVKPDKKFGGVEVKKDEEVFFIIDMQKEQKFDLVYIKNRVGYDYLKLLGATFLGSNTGEAEDFSVIMKNVKLDPKAKGDNVYVNLGVQQTYRYIKVLFTDWDMKNGSTIGISEFNIGTVSK